MPEQIETVLVRKDTWDVIMGRMPWLARAVFEADVIDTQKTSPVEQVSRSVKAGLFFGSLILLVVLGVTLIRKI